MSLEYDPEAIEYAELILGLKEEVIRNLKGEENYVKIVKEKFLEEITQSNNLFSVPLFNVKFIDNRSKKKSLTEEEFLDLARFFKISGPVKTLKIIADDLLKQPAIDGAYLKDLAYPAFVSKSPNFSKQINDQGSFSKETSQTKKDLKNNNTFTEQKYLEVAPSGINVNYAWKRSGGKGNDVNIISCESGWNLDHECISKKSISILEGENLGSLAFRNHGTAILGILTALKLENTDGLGDINITGISPEAEVSCISLASMASSTAIQKATDVLIEGDIILITSHRPGPDTTHAGQDGFIPIDWWPDDFAAIRYAVNRGIIVILSGGNGARNLDASIYDIPHAGFPSKWKNPFNPANDSSGAIIVGAGAPSTENHGPDRSRLGFSNYGAIVDAQGWGRDVVTTGYGNLQGGGDENKWYTDTFSGTSAAAAMVAGAVACLQGIRKKKGKSSFRPNEIKDLLRSTGYPQTDAYNRPHTQRIGNRPDLRQMIARI